MKKISSCDRYKIGFFGLLILIVGMFGYYVSTTKLSYQNRAAFNSLNEFTSTGVKPGSSGNAGIRPDMNRYGFVAVISSFIPVQETAKTYSITFKAAPYTPLGKGSSKNGVALMAETGDSSIRAQEDSEKPTCTFVGETVQKNAMLPKSAPDKINTDGTVTHTVPPTKFVEIPVAQLLSNDDYKNHTYMISYKYDPADQHVTCVISSIIVQSDIVAPSVTPSPTPTE
jgi:hypothetical protein